MARTEDTRDAVAFLDAQTANVQVSPITVTMNVEIYTVESLRAYMLNGPVHVVIIDKYAPKGMEQTVFQVVKVHPVNVVLEPIGGGKRVRIDPFCLAPADEQQVREATARTAKLFDVKLGNVVKVAGERWQGHHPDALFVVTARTIRDTLTLVPLCGTPTSQYWDNIPRDYVVAVIGPQDLSQALLRDPVFAARP